MPNKRELVPAVWTVDTAKIKKQIVNHYVKCLRNAENKLIELLREQIQAIDHAGGGGHGAPEWEAGVMRAVRTLYRDVAESYVEIGVGIPFKGETHAVSIEAMIYESGVGNQADDRMPPVQTRPGEIVWKTNMRRGISNALSQYDIPQFNQYGTHFIENAMKLMTKHFNDVLAEASAALPDSIFYKNIKSKKGAK